LRRRFVTQSQEKIEKSEYLKTENVFENAKFKGEELNKTDFQTEGFEI